MTKIRFLWLKMDFQKVVQDGKNWGKIGKMGGGEIWVRIPKCILLEWLPVPYKKY